MRPICISKTTIFLFSILFYFGLSSICPAAHFEQKELEKIKALNKHASALYKQGHHAEALTLVQRALVACQKTLKPDHLAIAQSLNILAMLNAAQEDYQTAFDLAVKSQLIVKNNICQGTGIPFEGEEFPFMGKPLDDLFVFFTLAINHQPFDSKVGKTVFDVWINRKNLVFDTERRFHKILYSTNDPKSMAIRKQLIQLRTELSGLVFSEPGEADAKAYINRIDTLEKQKQALTVELSRLGGVPALKREVKAVDSCNIAEQLPQGSVLIDFSRVDMFDFKALGKEKKWLPARYIAFVMHAGNGDRITMIDLGDADQIDKAIRKYSREIANPKGVFSGGKVLKKIARRLHEMVFSPVTQYLDNAKEIFISPDGNLDLLPFEVLQSSDGKYLIEDYTFNYLAASRDILRLKQKKEKPCRSLIIGNPDFGPGYQANSQRSGMHFSSLPGTGKEINAIKLILGRDNISLYQGKSASENVLFSYASPKFLHLATHGFFLNDLDLRMMAEKGGNRAEDSFQPDERKRRAMIENPLLRSGIVLAGANTHLGRSGNQKSDGIVTAEMILGLNLWGTEMVVLSTGLAGDGIRGLRQAFLQAGTQSLVMGMWSVPDGETRELMVQLYKNIAAGMRRNKALRQAALKQMCISRKRYGYAHPFYWGAFVFLGES